MLELGDKKIKEKGEFQGPIIQIQEYIFVEAREDGSSDKYKSRNDLYTKYGQDKKYSSEKTLNIFPKVRDIPNKEVSHITIKYHVNNNFNLEVASHDRVSKMRIDLQNILVPYKVHLHTHIGEVIYTDLLKATPKVSKL